MDPNDKFAFLKKLKMERQESKDGMSTRLRQSKVGIVAKSVIYPAVKKNLLSRVERNLSHQLSQ
jgi:hypothetical protein